MGGAGTVGAPAESAEGPSDMAARSGDARERRRRTLASAARRRVRRAPSLRNEESGRGVKDQTRTMLFFFEIAINMRQNSGK